MTFAILNMFKNSTFEEALFFLKEELVQLNSLTACSALKYLIYNNVSHRINKRYIVMLGRE